MSISTRPAQIADIPQVLSLMQELAVFENYAQHFQVKEHDLQNIIAASSSVHLIVADDGNGNCIALAVLYQQPFTYDMKPWFVLKEFVVQKAYRGDGVGPALFKAVIDFSRSHQASRLKWEVLADNTRAKRFYERLGGQLISEWQLYGLDLG